MSLEIMRVGKVVRASRERLTPGTLITGLVNYNQVRGLMRDFGRKLFIIIGEEKLKVRYRDSAEEKILIANIDFRNSKRFWGQIKPELALIVPAAGVSSVRARPPQELNPDRLALLLRYKLASTGKDRIYVVECSFSRDVAAPLVWVFAKEREKKDVMEKVLARRSPGYAQTLREGLDRIFAAP